VKLTIEFGSKDGRRTVRAGAAVVFLAAALAPVVLLGSQVTGLLTFSPGQTIKAADMNHNFQVIASAVDDNDTRIGDLTTLQTTAKTSLVAAVNDDTSRIGDLTTLQTTAKTSLVAAVNDDNSRIGDLTQLATTAKTDLVSAVNEVRHTSPIFGDGSAGTVTITGTTDWNKPIGTTSSPPTNLSFQDFTINAGATLFVPSGTVIRCTGNFTNNGALVVGPQAFTFSYSTSNFPSLTARPGGAQTEPAHFGDTANLPVTVGTAVAGGDGGTPLSELQARQYLHPGIFGGGEGAIIGTWRPCPAGGSLVILAQGAIVNAGGATISANGQSNTLAADGSGGSAGGVLILASRTSVTNGGTIRAFGGDGAASSASNGAGGGGGGGIVHLIAPSITNTFGTINVTPGAAGAVGGTGSVTTNPVRGGCGGGACGGAGGSGGGVDNTNTPLAATAGVAGQVLQSLVDPAVVY
jgi:hypothetical protein